MLRSLQDGFQIANCDFLFVCLCFWDRISLFLPRLECHGMTSIHLNLYLPSSSDSPALPFQVAGITGMHHHTQLILYFLLR